MKASGAIRVTNRRSARWYWVVLRVLLTGGIFAGGAIGIAAFGLYAHGASQLEERHYGEALFGSQTAGVNRFVAADGTVVGEWANERRADVTWEQLPPNLVLAFLAAEDARFFDHSGVDPRAILRALVANVRAGRITEGGSTITQQLAKIAVGREKTVSRKITEAALARRLEDLYSKEQILTLYLNRVYLGERAHGVEMAAQTYFHKHVWELNLAEMAMLAATPPQPSKVNPFRDLASTARGMEHVIEQMHRRGWITAEQRAEALATEVSVYAPNQDAYGWHVPYFTEPVRRHVADTYGADDSQSKDGSKAADSWMNRGLTVHMYADPATQHTARKAVADNLEQLARKQGFPGPLGSLPRDVFLERNARWLPADGSPPAPQSRRLGRVASVTKDTARVELSAQVGGAIALNDTRWAGPYTELPTDSNGRRDTDARVSWKPTLSDLTKALTVGDVVMVEVGEGSADQLALTLVPIPLVEGALVSYNLTSDTVDALVGGWDFDRSQVDRTTAVRQTGSTMKPIIYAKAYALGLPPSALLSGARFRDEGTKFDHGKTKADRIAWNALAHSENTISLRVLQHVLKQTSIDDYQAYGAKLGLPRVLAGNPAEVLGADQTPRAMAAAFGAFARRGFRPRLPLVHKIVDRDGRVLERAATPMAPIGHLDDLILSAWEHYDRPYEQALSQSISYIMVQNLAAVVQAGTAKRAKVLPQPVAGKTGTLAYDVWFVGFSRHRATAAWIGADRRERPLGPSEKDNKVYGSNTALPLFVDFMKELDRDRLVLEFVSKRPDDISFLRIDPKTGLLARSGGQIIPHLKGTEPSDFTYDETSPEKIDTIDTEF